MRDFKKWVNLSHKLPGIDGNKWLAIDFQALGRLDGELKEMHSSRRELIVYPESPQDQLFNLTESLRHEQEVHYSRLWVLSAYELVRILKELDSNSFKELYRQYRKLRIPMAKYEKIGKGKVLSIAWPATSLANGEIGWVLEDGFFITRDQLADELVEAVDGYIK